MTKPGFWQRIRIAGAALRARGTDAFWRDMLEGAGLLSTTSGQTVSEQTALKYAAFYAAVDRISCDIAKLPLKLMSRDSKGSRLPAREHPLYPLLHDDPNPEQTSFIFRQAMMSDALRWGNAFAEIVRNPAGSVVAAYQIPVETVRVERRGGRLVYVQHLGDGGSRVFFPDDILHIRCIGDGVTGHSPVRLFRETIGLGLAAEEAGASLFGNGLRPGGVLEHPAKLSDQAFARLRSQVEGQAAGSSKQGRLLITEEGMKYHAQSIPPSDAQYLETRTFQVRDIARIFRLPPHKLADLADATFSNVEEMNQEYVDDCLAPWLVQWEQEIARKLLMPVEREAGFYPHFNVKGLLRGKATERANFYARLFHIGAMSQNEIREAEDLNGIGDDGDQYFVPVNLRPSDSEYQVPGSGRAPETPPVNGLSADGGEPQNQRAVDAAHRKVLIDTCGRIERMKLRGNGKTQRDLYREMLEGPVGACIAAAGSGADVRLVIGDMLSSDTAEGMVRAAIVAITGETDGQSD